MAILRHLRHQMDANSRLEVAMTDQDLGPVNLHLAGEYGGLVEHLPATGRASPPRRVALWLDEPHAVDTFTKLAESRWERLSDQDKDRTAVMARLDAAFGDKA